MPPRRALVSLFAFLSVALLYFVLSSSELLYGPQVSSQKPIVNIFYNPPPKTGSFVTRAELRRFCNDNKLKCLSQSWPCPHIEDCLLTSEKVLPELKTIFWSAITLNRLKTCCPRAAKTKRFDGSIFHVFTADRKTKEFIESRLAPGSFSFTFIRDPVDQFISFFRFVTGSHSHIYGRYIKILQQKPQLEKTVDLFVGKAKMPDDYRHLYDNLNNIQSRILGWNGSKKTLKQLTKNLEKLDIVCVTDKLKDCWTILRHKLHWPEQYFNISTLRTPTTYNISKTLRQKILKIQQGDLVLYKKASEIFASKFAVP